MLAAPIGYPRGGQGGLAIDEEAAQTVRRISVMKAEGATLTAIAAAMNAHDVPTKRGGQWWPATVRYVFEIPKYRGRVEGRFTYSGAETHVARGGTHSAIIG